MTLLIEIFRLKLRLNNKVTQRVGVPVQIISDRASNVHKGIQLFQTQHPGVIYTYDVTHAMANLLKKEFMNTQAFLDFLTDCHRCRLQVQQTELDECCSSLVINLLFESFFLFQV